MRDCPIASIMIVNRLRVAGAVPLSPRPVEQIERGGLVRPTRCSWKLHTPKHYRGQPQ